MNTRFVKKPIEVDAFRFGFDTTPKWFFGEGIEIVETKDDYYCLVRTLEGTMRGEIGDYIIKGIKGEMYPCKADIFLASYDPVPCAYVAKVGAPFDAKVWSQPGNIIPCSE